jgi:transcriptional regulator with XRE-family HTH domain
MRKENLSGRKLAQRLQLSQPTVLTYLDAVAFPTEETRRKIAAVLGMTSVELDAQLDDSAVDSQISLDLLKQEIRAMDHESFVEVVQVVFDRLMSQMKTS